MNKIKTYKVNIIENKYWYCPSLFTFSRRLWASRPFSTLEELARNLEIKYNAAYYNFNGDLRFKAFNELQKMHKSGISINSTALKESGNSLKFDISENVEVILDDLSLKLIKKGKSFSCPMHFFDELYLEYFDEKKVTKDQKIRLTWRKYYFDIEVVGKAQIKE
ncbi:hypothetical protein NPA07_05280 [Mycoplasmopsis caviae]|uniref:Transposase n=2 Tax=Mycoplasmopsis caviae TaxID=55603 RepID=A0ABY5IYG5_9BACT|nr:hypothetical protein [Mycoplasmopsis caviae]UUD35187.1 hypothetical protein NPA07_05280 [Mycoplasmopsis caviae]